MPDMMDRAQELEEAHRETAIRKCGGIARDVNHSVHFQEITICTGCGDDIPAERRRAVPGTPRCVTCQKQLDAALGPAR